MYIPHIIFLIVYLISTALAPIPPPAPRWTITCLKFGAPPPAPDDCVHLLESMRTLPWVNNEITFGRSQPEPGKIPIERTYQSCRFTMESDRWMSEETGTFKLIGIFPTISTIIERCLEPPRGYMGGIMGHIGLIPFYFKLDRVPGANEMVGLASTGTIASA